jgi:two-component system nitrate/nitrite response regulator NarL
MLVGEWSPSESQLISDALRKDDSIEICGLCSTSSSIESEAENMKPEIVLLSDDMQDGKSKGFEVVQKLRSTHPEILCIVLMDSPHRAGVVKAFQAGARGVFCRTDSAKLLSKCVHCVHAGQVWAKSDELRFLLDVIRKGPTSSKTVVACDNLSKREHDVVHALAQGLSNREIANQLGLTEHTVKNYLFRIFDKLRVSTRVELVLHSLAAPSSASRRPMPVTRADRRSARRAALFSRGIHTVQ